MIKICNDRSVFPNSVKVSNQYENDTRSIDFDLSDVQFTGNTYLICKYQGQSTFYAPLLLDSNFSIPVETFLSAQPGAYTCVIVISTVTIDADYNFSSDNPLFVSNEFTLNVDPNFLTGTATAWQLTPAAQNYFDQLIALVDKVQEDLDNGSFVGNGIKSITLISTVGLVDTYQILFTDNSTFDFQVTNGATPTITIQDGVWFVNGISTGVSALGQKGDKGDPGVGIVSIEKTSTSGNVDTYTITFTNQTTSTFTVTNGTNGKDGVTPNIQIGTVDTLPAGSQATATITGTTENPLLNLGIPQGKTGGTTNYNDLENKPSINGVELIGNKTSGDLKMYTQEEVDYMLADKMDKPYVPIEITDSTTLNDCLAGNFKIDKIKGNTYQNVETDIVPTPQRPVPINSRKVKAGDEYIKLRSLKESKNLFDNRLFALLNHDYFALNDDGTGIKIIREEDRSIENIQYEISIHKLFYCHFMCSGGLMITIYSLEEGQDEWQMVKICNDDTTDVTFSVGNNNPAKLKFEIHSSISTETANIALYSYGVADETKYVPPTIRDYKIVDHANKTSKIIRNVHNVSFNKNSAWSRTGSDEKGYRFAISENQPLKILNYLEVNNGFSNMSNNAKNSVVNDDKSGSGWYCTQNSYNIKVDGLQMGTLDDFKQLLGDNEIIFQCQLAIAIEETISYIETDTTEMGLSWQDTTSPSPTIKSEVKGVEKIDILKTGKNLFDFSKIKEIDNLTIDYENKTITIPPKTNNAGYVNNLKDLMGGYKIGEKYVMSAKTSNPEAQRIIYFLDIESSIKFDEPFTLTEEMLNSPFAWYNNIESGNQNVISNIQIEQGDTATVYEPYAEQCVNYTPTNPMYSTQDGSICDYVDVEKGVEVYNMSGAVVFDGSEDENWLTNDNCFFIKIVNMITVLNSANFWCDSYTVKFSLDKGNVYINDGFMYFQIDKNQITSIEEWKQYISQKPITVVYPLATPTETPIPLEDLAKMKSLKTNAGVTNIFVGGEVKPTINARYPRDLALVQQQLEQKILLISDSLIDTQAKLLLQGGND